MKDIKQKGPVTKTIKAIDKAAISSERMKDAFIRTKDKAEDAYSAKSDSPSEYASDTVMHYTDRARDEVVHRADQVGRWGYDETKKSISKGAEKLRHDKAQRATQHAANTTKSENATQPTSASSKRAAECGARRTSATNARQTATSVKSTDTGVTTIRKRSEALAKKNIRNASSHTIKTAKTTDKAVKSTAKGTVKTAEKSVKTIQTTAHNTVKTAKATAKTTAVATKATVKGAKVAAQTAKAAAKATVVALKAAAKAAVAAVKAIIAAVKGLVALIAAGGWIAVVVILIICLIALIAGSVFGIFFSGEESGTGQTMQTAVREINNEYNAKLEEVKNSVSYDVLEMSGSRAVWKEVLAVYSVKVNSDPDNPLEVATMDDTKLQLLTSIFWEMNEITSTSEDVTETEITETDDGNGNIVLTETEVTQTYLYITVSHKTVDEMAELYGFNESQKSYLVELLDEEFNQLWTAVLYGIQSSDELIVSIALSQVGNIGGQPYWSWYGFGSRVEWCACFVSWCANEAGYIEIGVIPQFAYCPTGAQWFKDRDQWQDGSYEPVAGQIIFFDWENDGETDHVGIVQKVENGRVYTIEGNSGDSCRIRDYAVGSILIYGYGIPAY